MTPHRDDLVQQLFRDALQLDPAEREAFLRERCGRDADLRREVDSLLGHHDIEGGVLDRPPDFTRLGIPTPPGGFPPEPGQALVGARLGPYHILEFLAHGGMGAVYLAEQIEPVRRRVALKILRDPGGSQDILARFASERQALAMMDHPNIARIFDADTTEDGRPYFTMEYVPGVPLVEYCDHQKLSIEARLKIFIEVCEGVQHAHQKGIIHRDLKPSNILVTVRGGRPVPKIIDFGVAKALHQKLIDVTIHTLHGYLVGTPNYMSPEQAATGGRDLDTRADIYSLGVLLYELLTGEVPVDLRDGRDLGPAEIQRRIVEDTPVPPSRRIAADPDLAQGAAATRQATARSLVGQLRDELDWIVGRALEKERPRRYQTASELAADVERKLRGEAVVAGPPGLAYRARTAARRNRALVGASLVVTAVLVAATAVSVGFALRAQGDRRVAVEARSDAVRDRQRAELAAAESRRAEETARGAFDYFIQVMQQAAPQSGGSDELTLRQALENADSELDRLLESSPRVGAVVAAQVAQFHWSMENREKAVPRLRAALREFRASGPIDPEEHGSVAKMLGMAERDDGNLTVARELFTEAEAVYTAHDPEHFDLPILRDLQASLRDLEGYPDEARQMRLDAIERFEGAQGPLALNVSYVYRRLAYSEELRGRFDDAERHYNRGLAMCQQATDVAYHTTPYLRGLARVALATQRPELARQHLLRVERDARDHVPTDHPVRLETILLLAQAHLDLREVARAESLLAEVELRTASAERALGPTQVQLAWLRARSSREFGTLQDASLHARQARDLAARLLGPADGRDAARVEMESARVALAGGDRDAALAHARRADALWSRISDPTHPEWVETRRLVATTSSPGQENEGGG